MGCLSKKAQKIETVYNFLLFSLRSFLFSYLSPWVTPTTPTFFFLFSTQEQMAPQGRRGRLTLTPARAQWTQGQQGDLRTLENPHPGSPSLRTAPPQGQWQRLVLTSVR